MFGELMFHRSENQDEMRHELQVCKETNICPDRVGKDIQRLDLELQESDIR